MAADLEDEFNEAMLNIYRTAKDEAAYKAKAFLEMVVDRGGVAAAKELIHSSNVSSGYTALWERGRLDLTMEAMIEQTAKFHPLFTREELEICSSRLDDYGYERQVDTA